MDGDAAPLREIVALKEKYGAWLMVDEAHATGLYGKNRRGLAEESGVSGQIEVQMGTLGKAVGASGGYICGSRPLIDFLVNRARSFIFSAPRPFRPPPPRPPPGFALFNRAKVNGGENLLWSGLMNSNRQSAIGNRQFPAPSSRSSSATKPGRLQLPPRCASGTFLFRRFVIRPWLAAGAFACDPDRDSHAGRISTCSPH
jgi:hypothetical protein